MGTVLQKGMKDDRRFMLVDQDNMFITQRNLPVLSQFHLTMDGNVIQVNSKGANKDNYLLISLDAAGKSGISVSIWKDVVEVIEPNKEYSQWFSDALKMNCRLVHFPEKNTRRVNPDYVKDERNVSLADAYPYLLIGRNSLRDLNTRTSSEMTMKRFRPNLVFEGGEPYAEDNWKEFKIGDVHFTRVKPCDRCVLTTVDPETGIKGDEPLRTLATYRKVDNNVYFGQNLIAQNDGRVNEGDEIILL